MKHCNGCGNDKELTEFYLGHGKCKSCVKARQLNWYAENADRNYANSRRSKLADPERVKAQERKHRATPAAKARAYINNANRRAMERNAPGKFTIHDVTAMMEKQNGCCNACGCSIRSKYHIDHVVPLVAGGSNWPSNLQLLCPTCNLKKGPTLTCRPRLPTWSTHQRGAC